MIQAHELYRLQEIDVRIARLSTRLKAIDELLANDEMIRRAQNTVDADLAHIKPIQARQKDLEQQTLTAQTKRKSTEDRLYSGTVKNPKEMQDMQQEISSLGEWLGELEGRMLEVMLEMDEAQANLDASQAVLTQVRAERAGVHQELTDEHESKSKERSDLLSKRDHAAAILNADLLQKYERLRPQKNNQPVATLQGDSCSICGIEQTSTIARNIRRGEELYTCTSCKRLLVYIG